MRGLCFQNPEPIEKSEGGGQKKKKNSLKLKEGIISNRIWSYKLWNKLLLVQSKKNLKSEYALYVQWGKGNAREPREIN